MLDVFLVEIHVAIHVANPGLIYGAMIFKTFFGRLFWDLYGMIFWTLIRTLIGMLISLQNSTKFEKGMLIGTLIGMLISVQNSANV